MIVKHQVFPPLDNNCYLIVDEKTNCSALIDCSVFNDEMEALIGDTDLKYILLTHGHYDHIGGVKEVKEKYGCQVLISKQDEAMLSEAKLSLAAFTGGIQKSVRADGNVSDGDSILLGSINISVMATPGHTKGSVCYLAQDSIFTGDTLFFCSYGRTDFPGGSVKEMRNSLKKIASLEGDYQVYPGHEQLSSLAFERQYNPYMK